jgi:PAS domain S-box-containing protein
MPPTDMHLLPDGRVLVIAQRDLAFGDGMRWETIHAAEGHEPIYVHAAVDEAGGIYFGTDGGISRVEIGSDGLWRSSKATALPADPRLQGSAMVSVKTLARNWYWYSGSGALVLWRPGNQATVASSFSSVEQIFDFKGRLYVSDQSSGGLYRMSDDGKSAERVLAAAPLPSETVTATVPFSEQELLVGTSFVGLKLFDGTRFRPFVSSGVLSNGFRINDLCAAGPDLFAAAVDNVGVIFFNRSGTIVQVLERSLDHRLARVQRLLYSRDGVLWCLLNEGIARIEFPSPISHFDPLIGSGLAYAHPLRHAGQLWLLADGHAMRGIYDASHRLERLQDDSPPGRYIFTLDDVGGELFAASDSGIFRYADAKWTMVAPGVVNARIVTQLAPGTWAYVARGEMGVLRQTGDTFVTEATKMPYLGDNYNAAQDTAGIFWLELGNSRVGRLDWREKTPELKMLGSAQGLTDGWTEVFIFEGNARFHVRNHLFRYDERSNRFVEDQELLGRYPQLAIANGRPTTDAFGRLWFTANGTFNYLDLKDKTRRTSQPLAVGFAPTEYTVEENGVVWMFINRRLVRFDTREPERRAAPIQALITAAKLPASNRYFGSPKGQLPEISYADNSLLFQFAAPADPFASPVAFETLLDGAGTQWVSTGNVGSAAYNRLKEGDYVFRVRPVTANGIVGGEARLSFKILPPWYRTRIAWTLYVMAALGLIAGAAWLPAFLQRHENERLERLVARRTEELNSTNVQLGRQIAETTEKSAALAVSEERYRSLNAELENRVRERTAELSRSNAELQHRESLFRLVFEHAPVGISWKRADLDNVHHFNPTYRRILELRDETVADYAELARLVHPDDAPQQERMNHMIGSGEIDSYNVEERFVLGDGRLIWGSLSVAVIRDAEGRIVQDIGILEDITARKRAEEELATTYKNLLDASRVAGMAEVATGVLHNVGNVLNSLNVSSNLIATTVRQSRADSLARLASMLDEHAGDLTTFLTADPKGRRVPELLGQLAKHAVTERDWLQQETSSIQKNIDHIKDIVAMQQSYATVIGVVETLEPATLFDDALRMNTAALLRHDVRVVREFQPVPAIAVEKGKVLQILINVIRNAKYACDDGQQQYGIKEKVITLRIEPAPEGRVRLIVSDNGIGIARENLTRIFGHGFTTRAYGHGFGLHSAALAAQEMKGSLVAESEGLGRGATFILEIPGVSASVTSPGLPTVTGGSRAPMPSGRT